MQTPAIKCILLGEGCVGKTSIVLRYTSGAFEETHKTTLQAAFFEKNLNISGKRIKLAIWDTAGQERYHALGPIYYRDSKGAILVYDITDKDSFERVKNWVRELRRTLGTSVVLVIVGNKVDLEKDRRVSVEDAVQYAQSVGAKHMQTSARLNKGVEQVFLEVSKAIIEKMDQQPDMSAGGNRNVIIVDDTQKSPSKGCCG